MQLTGPNLFVLTMYYPMWEQNILDLVFALIRNVKKVMKLLDIQGGAKVGIQWSKKEKTYNV